MQIERRALYTSLRMNWLLDPDIDVETWQVEDYREVSLPKLFERLNDLNIRLDNPSFTAYAENFDSPEELCDALTGEEEEEEDADGQAQDRVYLVLFEIWRRLLPEKPCLSIFCDELDHQINLYDLEAVQSAEPLQDALANLLTILEENVEAGGEPIAVFDSISSGCANDLETFLCDFMAEQIDNENYSYAAELIEDFGEYISDLKWLDFFRARILDHTDSMAAHQLVRQVIEETISDKDLEFNFQILAFLVQGGDKDVFVKLVEHSLPLLLTEEDLLDMLTICIEFFHRLDAEKEEAALQKLYDQRAYRLSENPLDPQDPHLAELVAILHRT